MNKLLKVAAIVFAVFLIYKAPATAAAMAEEGAGFLGDLAGSAATMLGQLFG